MRRSGAFLAFLLSLLLLTAEPVLAADDSSVKGATNQVERGARTISDGAAETAKGIGHTVSDGAKYSGEKVKDAAEAAGPPARGAWASVRDGIGGAGRSVKTFFTSLFSK